jgi:hypothetical protein
MPLPERTRQDFERRIADLREQIGALERGDFRSHQRTTAESIERCKAWIADLERAMDTSA